MLKTTEDKTNKRLKTTMEKTNEFALKLQGGFALAQAIQIVENTKDQLTTEEYEAQMRMIAEIAENLATLDDHTPEA